MKMDIVPEINYSRGRNARIMIEPKEKYVQLTTGCKAVQP